MSLGSIVIQHNPVVSTPPGGSFNLVLYPTGILRVDKKTYRQKTLDMGGYWTAQFDILGPEAMTAEFLENGHGREVRAYNHEGILAWEGVITSMRLSTRSHQILGTMEKAKNNIFVRFSIGDIVKNLTAVVEDTEMKSRYGIFDFVDSLDRPVESSVPADTIAELHKKEFADPRRLKEFRDRGDSSIPVGMSKLTVFCSGYSWYLSRRIYNKTTRAYTNASTVVASIITDTGEFVASSSVATNTQQVGQEYSNDDISWDIITGACETGDTSNERYIAGMYDDRKLIYEQRATETLPNISLWKDANNQITDKSNRPLAGMLARPNTYMRNVSVRNSPGRVYTNVRDDPQVIYVASVEYKEKDQSVFIETEYKAERVSPNSSIIPPKRGNQ